MRSACGILDKRKAVRLRKVCLNVFNGAEHAGSLRREPVRPSFEVARYFQDSGGLLIG